MSDIGLEPQIQFWVITEKTKDFPMSFAVRRWRIIEGMRVADTECQLFKTLPESRDAIPDNCRKMDLLGVDDPVIVEWWLRQVMAKPERLEDLAGVVK